jgi:hypothetical protein
MKSDLVRVLSYARIVLGLYLLLIIVNLFFSWLIYFFELPAPVNAVERNGFVKQITSSVGASIFYLYFSAAFEETIFRMIPYLLVTSLTKTRKFLPLVAIFSGVVFGIIHGGGLLVYFAAIVNVILFFGLHEAVKIENDVAYSTVAITLSHFLYNLTLVLLNYM